MRSTILLSRNPKLVLPNVFGWFYWNLHRGSSNLAVTHLPVLYCDHHPPYSTQIHLVECKYLHIIMFSHWKSEAWHYHQIFNFSVFNGSLDKSNYKLMNKCLVFSPIVIFLDSSADPPLEKVIQSLRLLVQVRMARLILHVCACNHDTS